MDKKMSIIFALFGFFLVTMTSVVMADSILVNPSGYDISSWCGKVNMHYDGAEWLTDSDGVSGCNVMVDTSTRLDYCKKFWGNTTSVNLLGDSLVIGFCNAGNVDCGMTTVKPIYMCVQPIVIINDTVNETTNTTTNDTNIIVSSGKREHHGSIFNGVGSISVTIRDSNGDVISTSYVDEHNKHYDYIPVVDKSTGKVTIDLTKGKEFSDFQVWANNRI